MDTLNLAYDVTETRPYWKRALISLVTRRSVGARVCAAVEQQAACNRVRAHATKRRVRDFRSNGTSFQGGRFEREVSRNASCADATGFSPVRCAEAASAPASKATKPTPQHHFLSIPVSLAEAGMA